MERQLSELIRGLLKRGVGVTVVSRTCELEPHPRLRWVRVPGPARPFSLAYPWFFVAGSILVRRHRTGVLHTTGAIVGNRAAVCTVHFCHRGGGAGLRRAREASPVYRMNAAVARSLSRLGERALFRSSRAAVLATVSNGLAEELQGTTHASANVVVIPNGVDTKRFRPDAAARAGVRRELGLEAQCLLACFVGSEWERKGLALAIEAVSRADNWSLLVVGKGNEARYQQLARGLGVVDRVFFVGERSDVERWYAAADAAVVPSEYETFSLAAHEAAAVGLPVIATRVHGVDELLESGTAGFLVDRDAAAFGAALVQLEDAELRRRMGSEGRLLARTFEWSSSIDSYIELYVAACANARRARRVGSSVAA
jgi:UDP-glucose:(heptosyl)LPS alpha-1,3-glucosyltransferase